MIAIYSRVSTKKQITESQDRELELWSRSQTEQIEYYKDAATGKNMRRPDMDRLLRDIESNKITRLIIWRLDRLGRTARGLLQFFDVLKQYKVGFLSLKDAIDTETASGRLLLVILAGVAEFETEIR